MKRKYNLSEAGKQRIIDAQLARTNRDGHTHSLETKKKMSASRQQAIKEGRACKPGKKHSAAARKKMSIAKQKAISEGRWHKQKTGWYKSCIICNTSFYVTEYKKEKKHCSSKCVNADPIWKENWLKKIRAIDRSNFKRRCNPNLSEYKKYSGRVTRATEKTYKENIDIINPERHPRTLCGVVGGYQLDHIISKRHGFENNIPAEELAKVENLQIIPWEVNLKKGKHVLV